MFGVTYYLVSVSCLTSWTYKPLNKIIFYNIGKLVMKQWNHFCEKMIEIIAKMFDFTKLNNYLPLL